MEYHISLNGSDNNAGSRLAPFKTISAAAQAAQTGDVILVHAGVYRERVNPPRGGRSDAERIVYQAAPGEHVEIKGSEIVKGWVRLRGDTWTVTRPNSFFGSFNPYSDLVHGDWFNPLGRQHHSGAVYLNGDWLWEAATLEDVFEPVGPAPLWFGQVDETETRLWAQFKDADPNQALVEINVRQTVFYPDKPGRDFVTVRGFTLSQAATPWAPPTAEQIGLVGTHWSRGWLIEDNVISHSRCVGVTLGKYGDEFDNKSESADAYNKTIERALANGWSKGAVGSHVVRHNHISHCEQSGIVGSLGAVFSVIENNHLHDIHVQGLFSGAEMAGIKLHAAIDVQIRDNHIHHTVRGIWLDWMAQGPRLSRNVLHDNAMDDLFVEVSHGPYLLDNNLLLSPVSLRLWSQGGAFAHNLIAGEVIPLDYDERTTPYHQPHSTAVAGLHDNPNGDDRYYNNVFVGSSGLQAYDAARLPVWLDGNVFLGGAAVSRHEAGPLQLPQLVTAPRLETNADGWVLTMDLDGAWTTGRRRALVTTARLGEAAIPGQPYENADGTPLVIRLDYFGRERDENDPVPGPFEQLGSGRMVVQLG
jgi:Right handed beta helix region/Protein of unknown function (DUF1565)